jgi:hypothetical protein
MAYQTGTASGPAALLNSLATFASANGWSTQAIQGGRGFTSPDGATFALVAGADTLTIRGCVGLDGALAASAQPGAAAVSTVANAIAGPYAGYTFFAGAEDGAYYLHGVIEASAGVYKPFALGRLVKFDATSGGEYASAVNWFYTDNDTNYPLSQSHDYLFDSIHRNDGNDAWGHVRADLDGKANNWMPLKGDWEGNHALGAARSDGMAGALFGIGYQRYNKLVPILPIYVFGDRPSQLRSPLGYVPHLRLVDLRLLEPKQIITLGSEEWQVFPAHQRTTSWDVYQSATPSSAYIGYAFRKVA